MLSKNIQNSVKSTSETTNKIFIKKRNTSIQTLWCHIFPWLRNTPHQIPEVEFQMLHLMTSKSQNGIQEKKKFRTWKSSLAKQIPSLNFGCVHIEIFRSPPRLYSSFQLTSETKMDKFLQKIFGAEKKRTHLSIVTNTTPGESKQKNPTK